MFCETPLGKRVTVDLFLKTVADYLAGNFEEKPNPPPGDLADLVSQLEPDYLAFAALSPLLNGIFTRWGGTLAYEAGRVCNRIGEDLRARLKLKKILTSEHKAERLAVKIAIKSGPPHRLRQRLKYDKADEWTPEECVRAGSWLLEAVLDLTYFDWDADGFPILAPKWKGEFKRLREEMIWRDPVYMPHFKPPPEWTGWAAQYGDRLEATFVRDWRPETKRAIEEAFTGDFEHAKGVSALQRVPFIIDPVMRDLAARYAVDVMDHKGQRQRELDADTVENDVQTANGIGGAPFYLSYSCDRRGRIYANQYFSFGRQDFVRAMFRFHNGMKLGKKEDIETLELHCAKCGGFDGVDKARWLDRIKWAREKRDLIRAIADMPGITFPLWKDADKPFSFVAACCELAAAWADPQGFVTHLPVVFDGSANGLQHLSVISRDANAGRLVNLIGSDAPRDLYADVSSRVQQMLVLEADEHKWAAWWLKQLRRLDDKRRRKLMKTPVMTFAYAVTLEGMVAQITEAYRDLFEGLEPIAAAARYLAEKIEQASWELFPGPSKVMHHIRDIAEDCTNKGRFLKWISPTGMPVCNQYQRSKVKTISLSWSGVDVRYRVGDGCFPKPDKIKCLNAAAPNFIHSQDAAHLVRVVNAAAIEGITDIVTVHNSFACLAPRARDFLQVIRMQLRLLYDGRDPLGDLRALNDVDGLLIPRPGKLDLHDVLIAEYEFH